MNVIVCSLLIGIVGVGFEWFFVGTIRWRINSPSDLQIFSLVCISFVVLLLLLSFLLLVLYLLLWLCLWFNWWLFVLLFVVRGWFCDGVLMWFSRDCEVPLLLTPVIYIVLELYLCKNHNLCKGQTVPQGLLWDWINNFESCKRSSITKKNKEHDSLKRGEYGEYRGIHGEFTRNMKLRYEVKLYSWINTVQRIKSLIKNVQNHLQT